MNQILNTKFKNTKNNKNFFKLQFIFSITIQIILILFLIYYYIVINKNDILSTNLKKNYNIYRLYSKNAQNSIVEDDILGIIEIPKIGIKYSVYSKFDDELLKISPCRFYGKSPKENGNLCIAGHNYNNSMFFSNLFLLKNKDEIFIYDNYNNKYIYRVFSTYEVNSNDMSPIFNYNLSSKELTLVTCNNLNQNRLIVKAKQ